jgi:plasmid stability protein
MAQVLVRNLQEGVVRKLKRRARERRRSLQEELKDILEQAANQSPPATRTSIEQVRKMFAGRRFRDSSELIRQDRAR